MRDAHQHHLADNYLMWLLHGDQCEGGRERRLQAYILAKLFIHVDTDKASTCEQTQCGRLQKIFGVLLQLGRVLY